MARSSKWLVIAGTGVFIGIVIWFSALNGDQYITLDLGFVQFYRFPVTMVAFGALCTGMLVMLLAGVGTDLHVRRILRNRFIDEARTEDIPDTRQQSLFHDGAEPVHPRDWDMPAPR